MNRYLKKRRVHKLLPQSFCDHYFCFTQWKAISHLIYIRSGDNLPSHCHFCAKHLTNNSSVSMDGGDRPGPHKPNYQSYSKWQRDQLQDCPDIARWRNKHTEIHPARFVFPWDLHQAYELMLKSSSDFGSILQQMTEPQRESNPTPRGINFQHTQGQFLTNCDFGFFQLKKASTRRALRNVLLWKQPSSSQHRQGLQGWVLLGSSVVTGDFGAVL